MNDRIVKLADRGEPLAEDVGYVQTDTLTASV